MHFPAALRVLPVVIITVLCVFATFFRSGDPMLEPRRAALRTFSALSVVLAVLLIGVVAVIG